MVGDRIYHKAYRYFRICNGVLLLFALIKILATPYYALNSEITHVSLFLTALFYASVLQLVEALLTHYATHNHQIYY